MATVFTDLRWFIKTLQLSMYVVPVPASMPRVNARPWRSASARGIPRSRAPGRAGSTFPARSNRRPPARYRPVSARFHQDCRDIRITTSCSCSKTGKNGIGEDSGVEQGGYVGVRREREVHAYLVEHFAGAARDGIHSKWTVPKGATVMWWSMLMNDRYAAADKLGEFVSHPVEIAADRPVSPHHSPRRRAGGRRTVSVAGKKSNAGGKTRSRQDCVGLFPSRSTMSFTPSMAPMASPSGLTWVATR